MAKTQIPAGYIAANAIGSAEIAQNSITAVQIATGAVVAADVAANSITSGKIASNAILSRHIVNNSIVGADISATTSITAATFTGALTGNVTGTVSSVSNHSTDDLSEGSTNQYHTTERVQDVVGAQLVTNGSHTNITAAYDDAGDGAVDLSISDATIRGKISAGGDLSYNSTTGVMSFTERTDSEVRGLVSATDAGGDGSFTYNSTTGAFTYTGPSASETRAHFSAGTGVTLSSGEISIGQAVSTSSNVTFGNLTLSGNLTVQGTTTTLETATLNVEDKNITLNYSTGDSSGSADGAGITIQDAVNSTTDATILWDGTNDEFDFSHAINVTGNISTSGTVDGRDIASDGSKLDGIESGATADQTAAEILTAIKTVDGAGSGLDADLLDGLSSASFLRADAADSASGAISLTSTGNPLTLNAVVFNNTEPSGYYTGGTGTLAFDENFYSDSGYGTGTYDPATVFTGGNGGGLVIKNEDGWGAVFTSQNTRWASANWDNLTIDGNQVWHAGNDGAGSGLDADLLDGQSSAYYQAASTALTTSTTFGGDVSGAYNAIVIADDSHNHIISNVDGLQTALDAKLASSSYTAADVLTKIKTVDGAGSGLDADLLDGISSGSFIRNDTDNTITNTAVEVSFYSADVMETTTGDQATLEVYQDTAGADAFMQFHIGGDYAGYFGLKGDINDFAVGGWSYGATYHRVWHAGNDGAGSGLDADTLDGVQGSSYLRSDAADTFTTLSGTQLNIGSQVQLTESTDRSDLLMIKSATAGWGGLQISNTSNEFIASFMGDGSTIGVYDDQLGDWLWQSTENGGFRAYYNGSVKMETVTGGVDITGNLTATGNVTAYSSDERLKTNITPIENPIEKIKQLNGVEFDWKENVEELGFTPRLKHETGVIAQNVQSVIPDATPNAPFNEEYLTVQHEKIIPVLIEAIKEQQKQIEELKERLNK